MKSKLRQISVDNHVFMWTCKHDYIPGGDAYISRLFFCPKNVKESGAGVECFFKSHSIAWQGCALNFGFFGVKNGKELEINLNKPGFVAEFIRTVLANNVDFTRQKRYRFDNAWNFLIEMGFSPDSLKVEFRFWPVLANGEVSSEPIIRMLPVPYEDHLCKEKFINNPDGMLKHLLS